MLKITIEGTKQPLYMHKLRVLTNTLEEFTLKAVTPSAELDGELHITKAAVAHLRRINGFWDQGYAISIEPKGVS